MSQRQDDKPAAGEQSPETSGRREFIRQSLGVAPLMLTLGGRGHGGGASINGTLWSSLGTMWKHKGDWWRFKRGGWRWTKHSGDHWRERDKPATTEWKEHARPDDKVATKPKDWDWDQAEDRRQRELHAESKRRDWDWERGLERPTADRSYDWRQDGERKRSEGLSPLASNMGGTDGKKD